MRAFLIRWLASAVALMLVARGVDGFEVAGFKPAMLAVAVLAVGNLLLQPIAQIIKSLGCLLNLVTLGLFETVVSLVFWVFAFYLVGALEVGGRHLVGGFEVAGMQEAVIGALVLTFVNLCLSPWLNREHRSQRGDRDRSDRDRHRIEA